MLSLSLSRQILPVQYDKTRNYSCWYVACARREHDSLSLPSLPIPPIASATLPLLGPSGEFARLKEPTPCHNSAHAPCAPPDQNNADSLASTSLQTRLISKIAKHPPQRTTLLDPVPSTPPSLPPAELAPRLTRPRPCERSQQDKQRRNFEAPESLGPTAAKLATYNNTPKTWPPESPVPSPATR